MDVVQQKLGQIDAEIDQNQVQMDRLSAQSVFVDRYGNVIQMPLPDQYYALKRDSDALTASKQPLLQQQNALQKKVADVQAQIPVPKFTGVQQLIGVDGTPMHDPSSMGATTPSSRAD
jgi:hypothetical protein